MNLISYAQNFEDVILWRALKDIAGGFYIDIGAQSPTDDSVSALFYEKGWRGVHVEPSARFAADLRAARPDEEVIEAVVGRLDGEHDFYEVGTSGLNTGREDLARRHEAEGWQISGETVPSVRLSTILERYADRDIHWLKIDVEGMESEVVASWEPATARPWILAIESTLPNSEIESHAAWEPTILSLGYRFAYFDGLNRFYVHEAHADLMRHFGPGPNVFDGFLLAKSLQYHHRAALVVGEADARAKEQEQQDIAAAKLRAALAKAEATVRTVAEEKRRAEQRLAASLAEVDRQTAAIVKLKIANEDLGAAVALAENRLQSVYRSTSWRATLPLRGAAMVLGGGRRSGMSVGRGRFGGGLKGAVRAVLRLILTRVLGVLRRHPQMRSRAWKLVQRFPRLERRALAFVLARRPVADTVGLPLGVDWMLEPEPRALSAWQALITSTDEKA